MDLNPDVDRYAGPDVETFVGHIDRLEPVKDDSVDVVFVSNIFEHLTRDAILSSLTEARRVLKPAGRLLILQPWPWLVWLYLKLPLAWRVLGAQAFLVAVPVTRP